MEWTAEYDPAAGFARVVTAGRFTVSDHIGMIEDILGRSWWQPGLAVLFDHRALDFGDAGYAVMAEAGRNHLKHDTRIGDGKAAILMRDVSAFGTARQFELLVQDQAQARLQVFLDPAAAAAWLLE